MTIKVFLRGQELTYDKTLTVNELLRQLELSPQAYLVVRNGDLVTERDALKSGDKVKIISVISGGSQR